MINPLRGMKDTVGEFSKKYIFFIENCSRIAKNYGFSFIETPILEETALFKRSVGESSDIVGKEMYRFIDKGKNDVCMRPEGTAGAVRAFITQKYDRAGGVKRFFYHGSMFRYERPQKGRLRQFHQFGVETFGVEDVKEDAMIILMLKEIFDFFGIACKLQLNSLGCVTCMPTYKDNLIKFLDTIEGLCEDCIKRKATNPIRVLDCKNKNCNKLLENAPMLLENLCPTCKDDFSELKSILDEFGVVYSIDKKLVRGLDYYNKTAFEFISDNIGAKNAIAGGGRYDKLVEFLGGRSTAGVGFAIGIERIIDLIVMPKNKKNGYYIGAMSDNALKLVIKLVIKLRKSNVVHTQYISKSIKAHMKASDKAEAKYFI
ncbi:MAG: histidine--tRNA ligase, partial [Sulfurospirillum sp.]|nr:histidine--tRNA ligase [Sulfurospirillum sp.]